MLVGAHTRMVWLKLGVEEQLALLNETLTQLKLSESSDGVLARTVEVT